MRFEEIAQSVVVVGVVVSHDDSDEVTDPGDPEVREEGTSSDPVDRDRAGIDQKGSPAGQVENGRPSVSDVEKGEGQPIGRGASKTGEKEKD